MSRRTQLAVALVLGTLFFHRTLPVTARAPQAQAATTLARFTRGGRLQPASSGAVALGLPADSRQAFEKLATLGGVQVFFHRRFESAPLPPQETVLSAGDFAGALDKLAKLTGLFWEAYDAKTILVAPDDATIRRQVEAQVVRPIRLPLGSDAPKAAAIMADIRKRGEFKQMAISTPGKFILVRDAPERAMIAEEVVANAGGGPSASDPQTDAATFLTDMAGDMYVPEGAQLKRIISPAHAKLKPATLGSGTIQGPGNSRDVFAALANRAGVQVLFSRQFQQRQIAEPLNFDGMELVKALDLLAFRTDNFWLALDERTIVVAPNTPTVRRDVEPMTIKAFTVKNLNSQQEVTELVTALRTLTSLNQIALRSTQPVILFVRETPEKLAVVERIFAEYDRGSGDFSTRLAQLEADPAFPSGVFGVPTDIDESRAMRARLQLSSTAPATVRTNQSSREAFETIAGRVGIQVVFHGQFQNQAPFSFVCENCDFFTALDRLSFVTGNFWFVSGTRTIVVVTDNRVLRRETEEMIVKAIYFDNGSSRNQVIEAVTALRTLLSFDNIGTSEHANAIVVRDNADKVALGEKLVRTFDPKSVSSAPIPSGAFATPMDRDTRSARLRKQFPVDAVGPVSESFNQPPPEAFAAIAGIAGMKVDVHQDLLDSPPFVFRVANVDLITALDTLALQSGTYWAPRDQKTIAVAPGNTKTYRSAFPTSARTISLKNIHSQGGYSEVATLLRSIVSLPDIQVIPSGGACPKAIQIVDTDDALALAERIVPLIDVVRNPVYQRAPSVCDPVK